MLAPLVLAAAAVATPKPIRHLEFSVHYADVGGRWNEALGASTTGGGYDGMIYVDVLALAPNDGLVLSMRQEVRNAHSVDVPLAQLVAYPTGQLDLPANSIPLSQPELNLARFLGRKFINGDLLDEKNHWRIEYPPSRNLSIATDFTINSNTNGVLDITESQRIVAQLSTTYMRGHIIYDMNRGVPLSIHEEQIGNQVDFTYDYTLKSDTLVSTKQ